MINKKALKEAVWDVFVPIIGITFIITLLIVSVFLTFKIGLWSLLVIGIPFLAFCLYMRYGDLKEKYK